MSLFASVQIYGHRPIEADQAPDRPGRALFIEHPDYSQVYYGALEAERPQVWFRFEGRENQELYISLGVPVIERLEGYRPRVALIGPGIGDPASGAGGLPFELPDRLPGEEAGSPPASRGVEVYTGRGAPRYFHEHFTGTDSWIHIEVTRRLPRSGTYYLVAYTPANPQPGDKLWLSVGTKERFKLADLFTFSRWKRQIRAFHELR
jgi:hypothetical protein